MKYLCCKTIYSDLIFHPNSVTFCCAKVTDELFCIGYNERYDGSIISKEEYLHVRNKLIENFKKGIIPDVCRKCHYLEEKEWDESVGFQLISLAHKTKCSICNCIYCTLSLGDKDKKKESNNMETYDISPLLEYYREENMILPGCTLSVSGGECVEYSDGELEYITHFALVNDCIIEYLTSAVKYSECIAAALATIPSRIVVSVDSGTKETYEKIKRVKAYDIVWDNLKRYIQQSQNNKLGTVCIKYIIIPGVNDTLNEVQAFINKCKEVNCKEILIDMEFTYIATNQYNTAEGNLKEVIQYFYVQSKDKKSFDLDFTNDCKFWCIRQIN